MAKDGVVSIAIDYKNELNQMIRDYESALTKMASNDKLSKGMKAQFDNTIAELKRFKADMEKSFSDLSIGKVDKNSFKSFKETVNKNFDSVRAEIDRLDLAVSTINSQLKILGNGIDISKISSQFKDFQDYVQNTNSAIDTMVKKLDGQGISLISFDDSAVNQAKSQIKEINKLLKSTDEFSDAKGSKYELFDTEQAQAELDVLAKDLKNTLELIEKSESELSNFDKNSIGFEKTINQINILKLKAADLHDSIQQLIDIPDKTGEYTFGDSILISDDNVDKKVSEYEKIVKGTLDEIRESAIKTREELEKIVTPTSSKTASAKISDKLNPNSAELVTGVTIETTSSELWKKLSPIIEDLQNILNKNPVVSPVKLVVAPNAVSSEKNGEVGTISKSYSKKYQRELAKTGEDAVIDLEGVYKKTFTSIMDEAVSYSKETISKIQNVFESSPIKLHFDFNEEEFKNLSDALLSSDSGKKIDITGQIAESKKEVNELADKLTEVNELLNSADSKDFSFKGFDKFAEEISKSLGQLTELQSMLKALQNIESTLARASGVSSVTDIETQWQNVSKLIENSIKLDGTFRKNANVDKIASEYNNYLNMGGTNELLSIGKVGKLENSKNIIDAILSKIKELNSQKVDTSSVDKADDELKSVSSTLDDVISRLDHMINLTRDIGNTFYKMFKDASVSDLDKQWSSIESKFKSIADESGKINLYKQKKDIQELVEMYQKYANTGGMKTPFDLTDNAETIKKINKVYEQMNSKKNRTSVTNESKNFIKVEDSVNSLTSAINTKTEAIKTEANTMELAARAEVKSIQKIIDALNPLIERIESIPELKIPKEDTILPHKESNISSGMKDAFPSNEEVKQKEKLAEATRKLHQEEKQSSQDSVNSALKDQVSAWKQIQSIREKIAKADNPDFINQLQETKRYYQQQYLDATKILKSNQDLYDAQGQLNRLKQIELETTAKISQYQSKNTESVSKYNQSLKDNATQKLSTYNDSSKYTPEFIEQVNSKISEIGQLDITKPEDVARLKTIDSEVQKIVDDSKLLENKLVKQDSKIADIISQMKIFRSQNTNMSSSQKQALDDVINYAEKLANTGKVTAQQIEKIKISFSGLKAVVASSGNMGKNFFSQIGNRLTDMNSKFVAQFLSWQDWIRYIQQGINTVRELDTAMTEVRKVSNATETQYASFRDTVSSTAKEIATTNKELLNSSADFLRLGYSLDQASDLAKNATLFVNVGDGVDITEATEDMITAMKAFDIQAEDSIKIVDDYNQIGNQFALSASDIGEAMKRSASALETGNNSFEQSIGLITAMNEIVQNSENTGNSLKVLSLRLRGAKAELEDMQEDTDGLCDSTSKLREQIKSLTGVDIMIDDNTFKSTTDIIKELGAVWDKLSDSSQAATLELIAGKSRANNVAALLKNYQRIDEVMESLGDAEGSAMRENEAIVDSIDGRIKKLSASMEDFWQKAINTDFVKNIVSSLDTILNLLTKIINQFGLLPTIIGVGGAGTGIFKFIKNFDWVFKPYIKLSNSF
jgi:TP901 family phage tail tape measure protein|nr:MAG TPA: minor tail protein [Bacteriophage sp.]